MTFSLFAGYRIDPLGISAADGLMLSWSYSDEGEAGLAEVESYDVCVLEDPAGDEVLWRRAGVTSTAVRYDGPVPASRATRYWHVTATGGDGAAIRSHVGRFEIGLEQEADWSAQWISAPAPESRREQWNPAPLLRRAFTVEGPVTSARVYATALGVYRLWLNGIELTAEQLLRPGWTDYARRVPHQTFDVTGVLRQGGNVLAVELAPGWYAGRLGLLQEPEYYGDRLAFRCQLELDGRLVVATDSEWRCADGEIVATDLLNGETQDLRRRRVGWHDGSHDDGTWSRAEVRRDVAVTVVPQNHEPVRVHAELEGELVAGHFWGPVVFDFGQNVVGWTRIETATLEKGDILVRHGEALTPAKRVWRDNLRTAQQEDRYTPGEAGQYVLEPRHTVHGFRYAEVWGAPAGFYLGEGAPPRAMAIALDGGQRRVGSFECSDPELTELSRAIEWTIRDNSLEVLSDCPQRDERLGWLGDGSVIAPTAAYYFDFGAFLSKIAADVADGLAPDGMVPSYVPWVPGTNPDGAPGWSDGFVRLVHLSAERYGDVATARARYPELRRFVELLVEANPDGIRTNRVGDDFGDWLSLPIPWTEATPPGPTGFTGAWSTSSRRVLATGHLIRTFDQLADLAEWTGHADDVALWREHASRVRQAYAEAFVDADGRIESDTQTVYAQAVEFRLLDGEGVAAAAARLAELVRSTGHLTAGIQGAGLVLPALTRFGYLDEVDGILQRGEFPGWKYMLRNGATTIWEKWDGIREDGSFATPIMNSFNHPALGAVGAFLFERVAGLEARTAVRDRTLVIDPVYLQSLTWARAEHESACGPVSSSWERRGDEVVHRFQVPSGMRGVYRTPTGYRVDGSSDAEQRELTFGPGTSTIVVRRD